MKRALNLLFVTLLFLTSCQQKDVQRIEGTAFGTIYHISYIGEPDAALRTQIDSVLQTVNQSFSVFDTTSRISMINKGESDLLDDDLAQVLDLSLHISSTTDGAFDCTIQPLIELWGFGRKNQKQVVAQEDIDSTMQYCGYKRISVNGKTIVKTDPRVQLNFNAIAKGYAVDKLSQFINNKGYKNHIVEIGGEVVTRGNKYGKPWKVGIQVPTQSADGAVESSKTFELTDRAVATSGDYRNYFEKDGVRYTHILDPTTGKPEQTNLLSVTVIAPDCATADAYATAFMVLGIEKSSEIVKKDPSLEAYFIYDKGGIYRLQHIK